MKKKYSINDYINQPINKEQAQEIQDFNKNNQKNKTIRFLMLAMIYPFVVTYAASIMGIRETKVMNTLNHTFSYFDVLLPTTIITIFGAMFLVCLNHIVYKIIKITHDKAAWPVTFIAGSAFLCMWYNLTNYYMTDINESLITGQMMYYILMSNMFTFGVIFGIFAGIHVLFIPSVNEIEFVNEKNKEMFFSFDIENNLLDTIKDEKAIKNIKGLPLRQNLFDSIKSQGRDMYFFEYELMKNIK